MQPPPPVRPIFWSARTVSLAAFAGRTIRGRFAFTIDPTGSADTPKDTNPVGRFVNHVTLTGVQTATTGTPVAAGSTSSLTPLSTNPVGLQARSVLFDGYPRE